LFTAIPRHVKRRHTPRGLKELLKEFGVNATVVDTPLYVDDYITDSGVGDPMIVWVQIHSIDPFDFSVANYVEDYIGHTYVFGSKKIITPRFVYQVCEWERPAGVTMTVDWMTYNPVIHVAGISIMEPLGDDSLIAE
jgi:hypothetical protein